MFCRKSVPLCSKNALTPNDLPTQNWLRVTTKADN